MPYKRYGYGKKKSSRSRGWLSRNSARAGAVLRNRYTTGGKLSLSKIASDAKNAITIAKTLSGMLNVEKKRYEQNDYGILFAQLTRTGTADTLTGHRAWEITPTPSQGTGFGNKTGSSILIKGFHMQIQLIPQSAQKNPMKIRIQIVMTRNGQDFQTSEMYNYNKFIYSTSGGSNTIYDLTSNRDPDYFHKYQVIATKFVTIQPDPLTSDVMQKTFNIGCRFKKGHHVRFDDNTSTLTGNRFWIVCMADSGNCGTADSGLSYVPTVTALTGVQYNSNNIWYFIDN